MSDLETYRNKIDIIDSEIISLLASRLNICKEVALHKKKNNIPMMQPERVNQVIEKCIRLGSNFQLSEKLIETLYKIIIAEACRLEDDLIHGVAQKC